MSTRMLISIFACNGSYYTPLLGEMMREMKGEVQIELTKRVYVGPLQTRSHHYDENLQFDVNTSTSKLHRTTENLRRGDGSRADQEEQGRCPKGVSGWPHSIFR